MSKHNSYTAMKIFYIGLPDIQLFPESIYNFMILLIEVLYLFHLQKCS